MELYIISEIYKCKLFKFNSFLGITFVGDLRDEESTRGGFSIFGYSSKKENIDFKYIKIIKVLYWN